MAPYDPSTFQQDKDFIKETVSRFVRSLNEPSPIPWPNLN